MTRKIREFITAVQLERSFTKEEILEFYLNVVYFGRGAYGIASASQIYFGKAPADLTLSEAATLIALLKGPAFYDPGGRHPERAAQRKNVVLGQMVKYGYISEEQAGAAREEQVQLKTLRRPLPDRHRAALRGVHPPAAPRKGGEVRVRPLPGRHRGLHDPGQPDAAHANRAVEEHLTEYQKLFDGMWDWRKERDALTRVVDQAIRTSEEFRKATSRGSATASTTPSKTTPPGWIP